MRDAESMLDQLLSSSADGLDEARVRDLLGLADAETVTASSTRSSPPMRWRASGCSTGSRSAAATCAASSTRSSRRSGPGSSASSPLAGRAGAGPVAHPVTALAAAARRLAAIDPSRAGVGGLRLQLELALFPDGPAARRGTAPSRRGRPGSGRRDREGRGVEASAAEARRGRRRPRRADSAAEAATPAAEPAPDAAASDRTTSQGAGQTWPPRRPRPPKPPRLAAPSKRRREPAEPAEPAAAVAAAPTVAGARSDRRPRGPPRPLAGDRRADQRPPADEAAHRRLPARSASRTAS